MAHERIKIHIDDQTGRQIAAPEDARNGGSRQLQDEAARAWLAANPDKAMESKEVRKPEDKAVEKPQTKGRSS